MSSTFVDLVLAVCEMDRGDEAAAARSLSRWIGAIFGSCYKPEDRPLCSGERAVTVPRYEQRWIVASGTPRSITLAVRTTCAPRTWTHPQPMCGTHDMEWEP